MAEPHGSLSSGRFVISQRRSILHKRLHNLFNTSLNIAKRSAKTKLAHQGGCHIQFIKLVQRIISTPYRCIWCHSPATKPWSLLTKVLFSSLLAPLRQHQYQVVPRPWAVICCKPPLASYMISSFAPPSFDNSSGELKRGFARLDEAWGVWLKDL